MNNSVKNSIESISYLEFINNLDEIFYNLLYSAQNGYINLQGKNAVNDFVSYVEKFDYEVLKISDKTNVSNMTQVINLKKEDFIKELKKHYFREIQNWAQEVFEDLIQNILFCASLNKEDKQNLDTIYARALSAIGWLCDIRNFDSETRNMFVEKFDNDFKEALNSSFDEYLPKQRTIKTKPSLFLKVLKMYRKNFEDFMNLDFMQTTDEISQEDLAYFNTLKSKALSSEKIIKDDEIDLINSAVLILNLKADNQKYDFIKLVLKDFENFTVQHKSITEDDKISLIKRRIELFKDSLNSKEEYKYFKKLIAS